MIAGLANASSLIKDSDVVQMVTSVNAQMREDFGPVWHKSDAGAIFVPGGASAKPMDGVMLFLLADTQDQPDALAWHTENSDGSIVGIIQVKTILDAGGGILTAGKSGDSVNAAWSHEALEASKNPNVNLWGRRPITWQGQTYASLAYEICDPVQNGSYTKAGCQVSNFVLPSYFDEFNTKGPSWDWCNQLKGPLTSATPVAPGGYLAVRNAPGSETQVFGEDGEVMPWRQGSRKSKLGLRK